MSGDLQGEPGLRGQQGPKGTKGDQVRMSKLKHFPCLLWVCDKGARMCMFDEF